MRRFLKKRPNLRSKRIKKTFKRKALRRAVARIARREISRAAEDKTTRTQSAGRLQNYPPAGTSFDSKNIIDTSVILRNIQHGTQQGNRIGNKIKLKRFLMRATLFTNPGYAKPVIVKMFIISDKLNPTNVTALNIMDACDNTQFQPGGTFFENGTTTSGMTGGFGDLQMDVNTDRFTVHKTRVFKVGGASSPTTTPAANNDFKIVQHFKVNLLKYMPKVVKYQDALTNSWYTRKVFIVFAVINADDVANNVTPTDMASISYCLNVKFEDA